MKKLSPVLIAAMIVGCAQAPVPANSGQGTAAHAPDPSDVDRLVEFHEGRVRNDPNGALGLAMLSEAYLDRSRRRDDDASAIQAETAARRSLEVREVNNGRAALALTHALLEQHRFAEALAASRRAESLEPGNVAAQRQTAEILLELGRYDEFAKKIAKLDLTADPSGQAVLARWLEIKGENKEAEFALAKAAKTSEQAAASAPDTTAWFYTKLGEAQFRFGKIDDARKSLARALSLDPGSYKAAAAMTRVEAGVGNWPEVIRWGEQTTKTAKMTDIEGLVADGYRLTGNETRAEALYREIESQNATPEMLAAKPGPHSHGKKATSRHTHDRLFSLFLADRARHPFLAHHAAEEDLANRKDIYAWDTFAWATYQYYANVPARVTGEGDFLLHEAEHAIDKALATGVRDAKIHFHAGMIFREKNPERAQKHLASALVINPAFNAVQAAEAKEAINVIEIQLRERR